MPTFTRAGALALACGLAAGASPAAARAATPGVVYGGQTANGAALTVTLTRDRSAVAQVGVWLEDAEGDRLFSDVTRALAHPRISPAGAFAVAVRATLPDGVMTYRLAGRVSGAAMSGLVWGRLRPRDAGRDSVTFPAQRWTAVHSPGRVFAGRTSRGDPVVVELDRPGGALAAVHVPWVAQDFDLALWSCESFAALPLDHGTFDRSWTERTPLGGGDADLFDYSLAFSASTTTVSGTLRARVTQVLGDEEAGSVESDAIAFTARS
jgi:hypothetical protein